LVYLRLMALMEKSDEARLDSLILWFRDEAAEAAKGQAEPAVQAPELDAASSETEQQAAEVVKSEVLEAVPAAQAPDAASSIAAAKAKSRARQGQTDQQAAVAEKSAEEIRAEAEPRLDVFAFLCCGFVSLLVRLCVSCFLSFQMPRRLPKPLPRPSAADVAAYRCRSVRDDAQTTPRPTRPLLPIPVFSKACCEFKRRKMEADACVVCYCLCTCSGFLFGFAGDAAGQGADDAGMSRQPQGLAACVYPICL
jgi:hypothetical protein